MRRTNWIRTVTATLLVTCFHQSFSAYSQSSRSSIPIITPAAPSSTNSSNPQAQPTQKPTHTPKPTNSPTPTATITPTSTPTDTPTSPPSNTPTSAPTETGTPTATPTATSTADHGRPTPKPTHTPHPTGRPTESSTPTPTPTSTTAPACQDTIDNDGDNRVDLDDPGCSSPSDSDEGDETPRVTISAECVLESLNGTRTAYFSYQNNTEAPFEITSNPSGGTRNEFLSNEPLPPPPPIFSPGLHIGEIAIPYYGDSVTWILQPGGSSPQTATADITTRRCEPVIPFAQCGMSDTNGVSAVLGFDNQNQFSITIPIGIDNAIAGADTLDNQPSEFPPGLHTEAFSITLPIGAQATWNLVDQSVVIDSFLPGCDSACAEVFLTEIKDTIQSLTTSLASLVQSLTRKLRRETPGFTKTQAKRASRRAARYLTTTASTLAELPSHMYECPNAPADCAVVNLHASKDTLAAIQKGLIRLVRRLSRMRILRVRHSKSTLPAFRKQATTFTTQANASIKLIPEDGFSCN